MRGQEKYLGIILGIICVALCAGFVFYLASSDNTAPVIEFSGEEPVYTGNNKEELVSNVIATDERDGVLTETVEINNIQLTENDTKAKVTYVVRDSHNNMATAVQILDYIPPKEEIIEEEVVTPEPEIPEEEIPVDVDPSIPVLTLKTTSVTIGINDNFRYNDYIESMVDDVDSSDVLWRRIHLEGDYSTKAAGTYEIIFSVIDTEGKQSIPQILTLTRQ